jgi:hypothetical protein
METVLGVKWPMITSPQVALIVLIVSLVFLILVVLKIRDILKRKEYLIYQLFFFKAKQLGLTDFQTKILNNLIKYINLKNKSEIFQDYNIFEKSLGKFMSFLQNQREQADTLYEISKTLIKIHEKLYHPTIYKKPIERISEIEINLLLSFFNEKNNVYIGRMLAIDPDKIELRLFRKTRQFTTLINNKIKAYLFRIGDAEYTFDSKVLKIDRDKIDIILPDKIVRGKEVSHPYVDTIIPCLIIEEAEKLKTRKIQGIIVKLNQSEAIIKCNTIILYHDNYTVEFSIENFKIVITAVPIGTKTINENQIYYYSFMFNEISEEAQHVLHYYIIEHYS